uniref:Urotensin-2 n=1 Tax=Microcebus murinus TaxID=30608 RepID=A0A8C5XLE1_MICMU
HATLCSTSYLTLFLTHDLLLLSSSFSRDGDARLALQDPQGASALQALPETVAAGRGDVPRETGPTTNIFNPRGNLRKFQAFSGQDPFNILLSHLLAGTRKEYKKRGTPECFWKYCV